MVDYVYREFCQCIVYSMRCLNIRSHIVKNSNDDNVTLGSQYSQYPSCSPYRIPSQRVCMNVCLYVYICMYCMYDPSQLLISRKGFLYVDIQYVCVNKYSALELIIECRMYWSRLVQSARLK